MNYHHHKELSKESKFVIGVQFHQYQQMFTRDYVGSFNMFHTSLFPYACLELFLNHV